MVMYLMISVIMVQIFCSHTKTHYRTNGALQNVKARAQIHKLGGRQRKESPFDHSIETSGKKY